MYIFGVADPNNQGVRANIGTMVLDRLAERHGIFKSRKSYVMQEHPANIIFAQVGSRDLVLVYPKVELHQFGATVEELMDKMKVRRSEIAIVHDDIDFPLGRIRLKEKGGDGGHEAVRSVVATLNSHDFLRLRVGVGRGSKNVSKREFLSQHFSNDEYHAMTAVVNNSASAIETILREGVTAAKKKFHKIDFSKIDKIEAVPVPKRKVQLTQVSGSPLKGVAQSTSHPRVKPKWKDEYITQYDESGMHQAVEADFGPMEDPMGMHICRRVGLA